MMALAPWLLAPWLTVFAPAPPAPPPASTPSAEPPMDPRALARALARLPRTPTIEQVQSAAVRRSGVSPTTIRAWIRRARAAAVLPQLSVQADVDRGDGFRLDEEAGTADQLTTDKDRGRALRVKARWDLDRLIFTTDELRAVRAGLDVLDWRERVLVEVTRLYYERWRLLLEVELVPATGPQAAIDRLARLREIEGLLRAMTGLAFPRPPSRKTAPK